MMTCEIHGSGTNRSGFPAARPGRSWAGGADGKYKAKVLVVDDEELIAESVAEILRTDGFDVVVAFSGNEALELTKQLCPDIVLSDVLMPDLDGVETAIRIREACPETRILLFSGQAATSDLLERAKSKGHTFELLPKPLHPMRLIAAINRVM